jgi:hypothetical protein
MGDETPHRNKEARTMTILDLQSMEPENGHGGGGGGSHLSVALCDSVVSLTLCL